MNYIYDITLNLNKNKMFEFYEWKDDDNPEFILKIPMYKVDKQTFISIKNNDIVVEKKILESIEDKTETYSPSSINIIRYACVLSCEDSAFAIEFDSDGNNYMKSNISIEEENEILDICKNLKYTIFDYKVRKFIKPSKKILTRKEENIRKKIILKLENMKNENETSKLKYIFYEVYNEKLDDLDRIYNKLLNIANNDDNKFYRLNEILDLMDNKKIMSNNS